MTTDKVTIELVKAYRRSYMSSYGEITKKLGLSRSTVQYIIKTDYVRKKKKIGPDPIFTEKDKRLIKNAARKIQ